jgi:hypothetical protein
MEMWAARPRPSGRFPNGFHFAAQPPREPPWRRDLGLEPIYEFNLEDIPSFFQDMCVWQLFHRPEHEESNLKEVVLDAIHRYMERFRHERRREILHEASRVVSYAEAYARNLHGEAEDRVRRWETLERQNRFIAAGANYPLLNEARRWVSQSL